ncbi:MAG: hypothetical protein ACM3JJ_12920 [Hyphomicrobiales bacterium]
MEIFLAQEGPFPERSGGDAGFAAALDALCRIKSAPRLDCIDEGPARVGTLDRVIPTKEKIARDPATGTWMVAAGAWFHPNVRAGDRAQQLLQAYLRDRARFWDEIDGYFGFAIYDAQAGQLVVASDIIGCFHVYYRFLDGFTFVSTSSLALAALGERHYDPVSQFEFLTKGTIFEDRTHFTDVRKCRPGTVHSFQGGREVAARRYWSVADLPLGSLRAEPAVERIASSMIALASQVPQVARRPLADLTGGSDSRTIVAALLAANVPVATTVTGADHDPDVRVSLQVAKAMGFDHRKIDRPPDWPSEFLGWTARALPLTEGEYDLFEYAGILHTHWTALDSFDMTLNGSGAGAVKGAWWEIEYPRAGASPYLHADRLARVRFANRNFEAGIFREGFPYDLTAHFTRLIEEANRGLEAQPNSAKIDNTYLMLRLQRWQGRISSSTTQLWPCLSLFSCKEPLGTALCVVPEDRRGGRMAGRLLQAIHPRLASFRLAGGYPATPPSVFDVGIQLAKVRDLGRRGFRKALRLAKLRPTVGRSPALMHRCLVALWNDEETRSLLAPDSMEFRDLYRREALSQFFSSSRNPEFGHWRQLGRIYTMERMAALLNGIPPLRRPLVTGPEPGRA